MEKLTGSYDPIFQSQVQRLHRLTVWSRWLFVLVMWLTAGSFSIWVLRFEIFLWVQYFTWAAVRYSLAYNLLPALGLTLCIAMTVSVLIWQSRNILFGLPRSEKQRLEAQVMRIIQQGKSHPLWKWVCDKSD